MYFTQEDYKKIEEWLKGNSVKDTEFPSAQDLKGDEILIITQEGFNRKLCIRDLVNNIAKLRIPDFVNITTTYDSPNITLEEAVRVIPFQARKEGKIITFSNSNGIWETYQFTGAITQWNNTSTWNKLF